jgi:hypothetical protein
MIFAPKLPADEWAEERRKIASRKPHLVLVDRRPDPELYRWYRVEDLVPVKGFL